MSRFDLHSVDDTREHCTTPITFTPEKTPFVKTFVYTPATELLGLQPS